MHLFQSFDWSFLIVIYQDDDEEAWKGEKRGTRHWRKSVGKNWENEHISPFSSLDARVQDTECTSHAQII